MARANIRLLMFIRSKGLEIPREKDLVKMFPLENYR